MLFGAYSLSSLGLGLCRFKDVDGEVDLLNQDVKRAKEDLKKRKLIPKNA